MKSFINFLCTPWLFFPLAAALFALALVYRRALVGTRAGLAILVGLTVFFVVSLFDENFAKIALKPDNVPIVGMLFGVGFFAWLAFRQAVENDRRIEQGLAPREAEDGAGKVNVWPDLVYSELIVMVLVTVVLIVWSLVLKAPLEEPANPTLSPNPAKAPWYFLGLQEMLVYFDPWIAGVVLPGFIVVGLMLIPYMDPSREGSGYYSFSRRKFGITVFCFGFLVLWILLIGVGTFLRGPNWNFFGPFEFWDVHKLEAQTNINLSQIVYMKILHRQAPGHWFVREFVGIALVGGYFVVGSLLLARTMLKQFRQAMGICRFYMMVLMLLTMGGLVVKMFLRWTINLKYLVFIPEYFFNI